MDLDTLFIIYGVGAIFGFLAEGFRQMRARDQIYDSGEVFFAGLLWPLLLAGIILVYAFMAISNLFTLGVTFLIEQAYELSKPIFQKIELAKFDFDEWRRERKYRNLERKQAKKEAKQDRIELL